MHDRLIRRAFNKAANTYNKFAFVQQEIALRLIDNLNIIDFKPKIIADLGAGTGLLTKLLLSKYPSENIIAIDFAEETLKLNQRKSKRIKAVCTNSYHLPFKDNSIDFIISNLMLQWCANLDEILIEIHRVLKKNGLFIFSTFGPDTLIELKKSWAEVDNNKHINDFFDMHTVGNELIKAKYLNPVINRENITLTYDNVIDLLKDIKCIGANTVNNANKTLTPKFKFNAMLKNYEKFRINNVLPTTYEVIYAHAWK